MEGSFIVIDPPFMAACSRHVYIYGTVTDSYIRFRIFQVLRRNSSLEISC